MMPRPRITVVGGGSYAWCPKLIRDVLSAEELQNADFRLLDPNQGAADVIAAIGRRYASEWNLKATFTPTRNPDRALDGADFIIITISTGGEDAMKHDLAIPERYGIFQTVGDTVGPGGWARGLRNIPVFVKLSEQFAKNCPNAMILNYTNPMTTLTKTLSVMIAQPVVGLCHGLFQNYTHLMTIFGLKHESDLRATYCGINHFFWFLDFTIRGKPGYPLLRRKLGRNKRLDDLLKDAYVDPHGHSSVRRLVATELFEEFGYLPYMGDRHTSEFLSWYLAPSRAKLKKYHLHQTTIVERRAQRRKTRQMAIDLARGKTPLERKRSRESVADIMAARVANREFIDVMNLPNIGQVANLPIGAVLETPGVVSAIGFTPITVGPMPRQLLNLTMPHVINQELIVEAGLEGDWEKAFQALINDPLCSHLTIPRIRKMGRQLLEANRRYLPQFFGRRSRPR